MIAAEKRLRDATEELIVACNSSVRPEKIAKAQREWDDALAELCKAEYRRGLEDAGPISDTLNRWLERGQV